MSNIIRNRSTHAGRLDRWLGPEQAESISASMREWHGPPIAVAGVPGSVWAHKGGDFRGPIASGQFLHVRDFVAMRAKRIGRNFARRQMGQANAGFASMADLLTEARTGKARYYQFSKAISGNAFGSASSLWRIAGTPPVGTAPGAAPGGTAFNSASTGAFPFSNPGGGDTQHFVRGEINTTQVNNLLLYDLIFGVAKTMNSTSAEAVTGVPTRYQSTTPTDPDYAGGNFLFAQVGGTALPATAHDWTVCLYTDQGGASSTLPTITGVASAETDRLDHPLSQWFAPLETGDVGVKDLTQMQCSALVATGVVWFMIGHPIAFIPSPVAFMPFCVTDGILGAFNLVRIFDDAALALMTVAKPSNTGATAIGTFQTVSG